MMSGFKIAIKRIEALNVMNVQGWLVIVVIAAMLACPFVSLTYGFSDVFPIGPIFFAISALPSPVIFAAVGSREIFAGASLRAKTLVTMRANNIEWCAASLTDQLDTVVHMVMLISSFAFCVAKHQGSYLTRPFKFGFATVIAGNLNLVDLGCSPFLKAGSVTKMSRGRMYFAAVYCAAVSAVKRSHVDTPVVSSEKFEWAHRSESGVCQHVISMLKPAFIIAQGAA